MLADLVGGKFGVVASLANDGGTFIGEANMYTFASTQRRKGVCRVWSWQRFAKAVIVVL